MRTRLLDHKSMAPLGRDCVADGGVEHLSTCGPPALHALHACPIRHWVFVYAKDRNTEHAVGCVAYYKTAYNKMRIVPY